MFELRITLGDEAMRTLLDVAAVLEFLAADLRCLSLRDGYVRR